MGPSKQLKQIIQTKHNIVKKPNWPEANQLAVHKRGWGFEFGASEKQIQVVVRAGLEPGNARLWVRHADYLATLPSTDSNYLFKEKKKRISLMSLQCKTNSGDQQKEYSFESLGT